MGSGHIERRASPVRAVHRVRPQGRDAPDRAMVSGEIGIQAFPVDEMSL
jgi:hypothetical protein